MNNRNKIKDKTFFSGIKLNEPLAKYTTFKIGGRAKYFFVAKGEKDLIKILAWAKENRTPYFILGGGSNLLISDKGFNGIVIKIQDIKYKIQSASWRTKFKIIKIDGGVPLSKLVSLTSKRGLTGLEWAVGIPGTVGGAVRGNAGAFGECMADAVKSVKALAVNDLRLKIYQKKDCQFKYRDSLFKRNPNLIVFSVELQLRKGDKNEIQKKIKEYLNYREKIQPLNFSAGCVFKNIEIAGLKNKNILKIIPQEKIKGGKLPAGYLMEKAGLKGKRRGHAQISEKHANFIINLGGAKANDVVYLINLAKRKVKKRFGVNLEEEIKYLGF